MSRDPQGDLFAPVPPRPRKGSPYLTRAAAREAIEEARPSLLSLVLDAIAAAGPNGLTRGEIEEQIGIHPNTLNARLAELRETGAIARGEVRANGPSPRARLAVAWVATGKERS